MDNISINRLSNIINDSLVNIGEDYISDKKTYISGKWAAYCPRYNYLNSKLEVQNTMSTLGKVSAEFGKIYETLILKSLQESGKLMGYDLTLNWETFPIKHLDYFGVIDAVIEDENNLYLVDFKTKHELYIPTKSKKEDKQGTKELIKISEQDMKQVAFYASLVGLDPYLVMLSRKVNEEYGKIAYEVIPIEHNVKNTLHMAFFSSYCIKHNILPRIPKNFKKTVNCKYCDFYDICWNDKNLEFSYNELTLDAYAITEEYTDNYLNNIDSQRDKFLTLVRNDKLKGKYYKALEERL